MDCKGTLLTRGQLVHQDPQYAFQLIGPQPILILRVIYPHVQDFAFPSTELPGVSVSSFIQPIEDILIGEAQPSGVSATPPSANLLRVHSVPLPDH